MVNIFCVILAYLLGSIETSLILCKFLGFPDPRTRGSHSAGATNVLRTTGKNQALLTLIGDVVKGALAVIIGRLFHIDPFFLATTVLAAVIGHMYPCFFQFRGGKGVATAIGGLLILTPFIAILLIIFWLVIVLLTRYISLASIIAAAAAPILVLIFSSLRMNYFFPILIMAALIIWKHSENIRRLRTGTEGKVKLSS